MIRVNHTLTMWDDSHCFYLCLIIVKSMLKECSQNQGMFPEWRNDPRLKDWSSYRKALTFYNNLPSCLTTIFPTVYKNNRSTLANHKNIHFTKTYFPPLPLFSPRGLPTPSLIITVASKRQIYITFISSNPLLYLSLHLLTINAYVGLFILYLPFLKFY